jgi:hypothetical protein
VIFSGKSGSTILFRRLKILQHIGLKHSEIISNLFLCSEMSRNSLLYISIYIVARYRWEKGEGDLVYLKNVIFCRKSGLTILFRRPKSPQDKSSQTSGRS